MLLPRMIKPGTVLNIRFLESIYRRGGWRVEAEDGKILGRKGEHFVTSLQRKSENFAAADRRIRLETYFFVADLRVDQVGQ